MPVITDYSIGVNEDGLLTVSLSPPTPIADWTIRYMEQKRDGGISGFNFKYYGPDAGGGVSGITLVDAGQGTFNVQLNAVDSSGMDPANYVWSAERMDSGFRTTVACGTKSLTPGAGLP